MESIEIIKTFLTSWPLVILIITLLLIRDIKLLITRTAKIKVLIGGKEVLLDFNETNEVVSSMLYSMEKTLKKDRLQIFLAILEFTNNKPTIKDIFGQELERDEEHEAIGKSIPILTTLRALRGFDLIQPSEGNRARWEANSEIEITRFGKFVSENEQLKVLLEKN